MLTRWGFTTVWDLGSDARDTTAVAPAGQFGRGAGPGLSMLAGSIFPRDGHPAYLPAEMQLPEAATPERSRANGARTYMGFGLDGMKLFTGSFKGSGKPVVNMDPAIAKAAVDVAHAAGKPVFAHPQNMAGVEAVIAAGVDIMAHTVAGEPVYSPEQLARFKQQGIALVPTLSLFAKLPVAPDIAARLVATTVNQVKAFSDNGGPVLFGTDVGFTTLLRHDARIRADASRAVGAPDPGVADDQPGAIFQGREEGARREGV